MVNKKFVGEYAVVSLVISWGNPMPTLVGLGVICSSVSLGLPDPNWICKFVSVVRRVVKRLCIFFNWSK